VVEAAFSCGSDIHSRALADCGETFENGDRGCVIALLFSHAKPPYQIR